MEKSDALYFKALYTKVTILNHIRKVLYKSNTVKEIADNLLFDVAYKQVSESPSKRTVHRLLVSINTSYHRLVDIERQKYCHELLLANVAVSAVSELLGFKSRSSFDQAFKRWHNTSPTLYLKTLKENHHEAPIHREPSSGQCGTRTLPSDAPRHHRQQLHLA